MRLFVLWKPPILDRVRSIGERHARRVPHHGLTTQMFVAEEPLNAKDGIYNTIRDRKARETLTVSLTEDPSGAAKLAGNFDIVLAADGRFDG